MIKAKDIKWFLVEKLPIPVFEEWGKLDHEIEARHCAEHGNAIITEQGERQLGLNREKLAKMICANFQTSGHDTKWESAHVNFKNWCLDKADAIISAESDLIEYKE